MRGRGGSKWVCIRSIGLKIRLTTALASTFRAGPSTSLRQLQRRGNTAILIQGDPGWEKAILYRNPQGMLLFRVNDSGDGYFDGRVRAKGFDVDPSSEAAKENVVELTDQEALGFLGQLNPVTYSLKGRPGARQMGFIAEQVPPAFTQDGQSVSLMEFIATLTRVVKVHEATIRELEAQLEALEQRP